MQRAELHAEEQTHTHTHHSNTYHSDTQTRFFLSSTRTHAHFTGRQGVDRSGIWSCLTWKEKKKGWKKEAKKNQGRVRTLPGLCAFCLRTLNGFQKITPEWIMSSACYLYDCNSIWWLTMALSAVMETWKAVPAPAANVRGKAPKGRYNHHWSALMRHSGKKNMTLYGFICVCVI